MTPAAPLTEELLEVLHAVCDASRPASPRTPTPAGIGEAVGQSRDRTIVDLVALMSLQLIEEREFVADSARLKVWGPTDAGWEAYTDPDKSFGSDRDLMVAVFGNRSGWVEVNGAARVLGISTQAARVHLERMLSLGLLEHMSTPDARAVDYFQLSGAGSSFSTSTP